MNLNIAHIANQKTFTHFELTYVNGGGRLDFNFINVQGFLVERGYFIYRHSVTKHIYIRIIDNIVREVGKKDIKDEVLEFIKAEEPRTVYEFALKNAAKIINCEFLETLPAKQIHFKKDKIDMMQIYFQNCIAQVHKTKVKTFPYSELPKDVYIWESQILQREYNPDVKDNSDFKTFCWNVANRDAKRFESICTALGYAIHNFKNPAYLPCLIFNDEVISDDPEGGTGKGILFNAISKYIKFLNIDGKTINFDKSFLYQRVDKDTRFICFQDVRKNFDFDKLHSVLTEGITTEKKGRDEIFIDFEDSPKIGITTNYAIRGRGNTNDRRRFDIEISQYYNKDCTPLKDLGRMLFYGWDAEEWQRFDSFMIGCCQLYLANGLVQQTLINLPQKKLLAETNQDFIRFMEGFTFEMVGKADLYTQFLQENDDYLKHKWFSKQCFTNWVTVFADHNKYKVEDYNDGSKRYYKFTLQTLQS